MPRGPLLKTTVKKIKAFTEAKLEAERKFYEKHPEKWFGERIAQLFGNTSLHDVAELGVVLAFTPIVKNTIDMTAELTAQVEELLKVGRIPSPAGKVEFVSPLEFMLQALTFGLLGPKRWVTKKEKGAFERLEEIAGPMFAGPDWQMWIISFAISYMIVHNFSDILRFVGAAGDTLSKLIGFLLGGSIFHP